MIYKDILFNTIPITAYSCIVDEKTVDMFFAREWIGVGTTRCSSSAYKPIRQFDVLKVFIDDCLGATVDGHVPDFDMILPEGKCNINPFPVPVIDTPGSIFVFDRHPVFGNTGTVIIQVVRMIDGDEHFTLPWGLRGEIEIDLRSASIQTGAFHITVPIICATSSRRLAFVSFKKPFIKPVYLLQ